MSNENKKITTKPILTIKGQNLGLDKNHGPIGLWVYDTAFKRSLTDDLIRAIDPSRQEIDALLLYRLIYVMSGINERISFIDLLQEIPKTNNILMHRETILEKASDVYLPMESQEVESEGKKETND